MVTRQTMEKGWVDVGEKEKAEREWEYMSKLVTHSNSEEVGANWGRAGVDFIDGEQSPHLIGGERAYK